MAILIFAVVVLFITLVAVARQRGRGGVIPVYYRGHSIDEGRLLLVRSRGASGRAGVNRHVSLPDIAFVERASHGVLKLALNDANRLRPYSDICYSPVTLHNARIGFLGIARPPGYPDRFCRSDLSFFSITAPLLDNALSAFVDREKAALAVRAGAVDSAILLVHADGSLEATFGSDFRMLRSLCGIRNAKSCRNQDSHVIHEIMARLTASGGGHCSQGNTAVSNGLNRYTVRWRSVDGDSDGILGYSDVVGIITIQKPMPMYDLDRGISSLSLSHREKEVVRLLFRGFSNRDICESLYITEDTVKRHVSNILGKAGVRSRSQLVFKLISMQQS